MNTPSNMGFWTTVETPMGPFMVASLGGAIIRSALPGSDLGAFLDELNQAHPGITFHHAPHEPLLQKAGAQLVEYAQGTRKQFDVPLRPEGTVFQRMVWQSLARIPYGEVRSYQDIARDIGRPGASRAVGQANHNNPVAPFIPCHRVITANGSLGGYGGGMPLKRRLLNLEGAQIGD